MLQPLPEQEISKQANKRRTLIGMVSLIAFVGASFFAWKTINSSDPAAGTPAPYRVALDANESFFSALFGKRYSKEFSRSAAAKNVRVNGNYGLKNSADTADWKLRVIRKPGDTLFITLDDIRKLPKTEITFNFKCIEGWSQITNWGGVRFRDFVKHYNLSNEAAAGYVGLVTPDSAYYVGNDRASMMHPQTILCYEMNGAALPMNQGFPLRLIIPVKYGVKHLKRIGYMYFSNERPKDFWYERGYDYYCGL